MKQFAICEVEGTLTVTGLYPGVRLLVAPEEDVMNWYFNDIVKSESVDIRVQQGVPLLVRIRSVGIIPFDTHMTMTYKCRKTFVCVVDDIMD